MYEQFIKPNLGKLLGAGVGAFGGIPGVGIGIVVGGILDYITNKPKTSSTGQLRERTNVDASLDFVVSALLLAGAVIKSDEEVSDLEMSYIRTFISEQFGEENTLEYIAILKQAIGKSFDLKETCERVRETSTYETRLQILYLLFGIAGSDFNMDMREINIIRAISNHLNISNNDYNSIRAMFDNEMDAYYRILEIMPSVSDAEVKAAYHEMAVKYHPDKVAHLGELIQHTAHQKFTKVQEAYDIIKRERGFR